MKKRKELNALIGLGDSKRKKTKKGSGHRLLRTEPPDSESDSSSDDDEFHNMDSGANFGKRSYTRCCNVCYPLFLFIILAACVMACAGLIWMQIALKEDLDSMKEKLHSIESSQKVSSSEIPKLSEDLKNKERKLDEVENGNKGLNKLWSNLTEMNRKISLLDSAVNHLKANLKSASDLINLPTTVEELQKSVATIGSTLTSVQHDVQTMQTALEDQRREEDGPKKSMELTELRQEVSQANKTEEQHHTWTDEQIHLLLSTVAELHQRLTSLERDSVRSSKGAETQSQAASTSSGRPEEAQSSREEATTPAAPGDKQVTEKPRTPAQTQTNRQPRFLRPKRSQRSRDQRCPASLSLPGLTSLKGVEEVFRQAGRDGRGLSFQELREVLGASTPSARTLECFDRDGDGRYSLLELRAAVGSHSSLDGAERY